MLRMWVLRNGTYDAGMPSLIRPDTSTGMPRAAQTLLKLMPVAMTAINSHAILPIARECARLEPDLFLIYMAQFIFWLTCSHPLQAINRHHTLAKTLFISSILTIALVLAVALGTPPLV